MRYHTSFPSTENPISEGGAWTGAGSSWTQVSVAGGSPGLAHGTQTGSGGQDDSNAHLSGFGPDTTVTIVVTNTSLPGGANKEVEILLRWATPDATHTTGYELTMESQSLYAYIVRWNGLFNDFTILAGPFNPQSPVTGDLYRGYMVGTVINFEKFIAGSWNAFATPYDTVGDSPKYSSGNPGIGFYIDPLGVNTEFGIQDYLADDGLSAPAPVGRFIAPVLLW